MPDGGRQAGLHVHLRQAGPIPLRVDLHCAPGEVLALVGPSGAGKSTVLRAIAGLHRPREGRIACGDAVWLDTARGVDRPAHRRAVGLVFQSYALFPHMSALGNVVAALGERPHAEREARARALLGLVGLGDLAARKPAFLSGGQQQRVALARALAREPQALLLDEPFAAVDRRARRRLREDLAALRGTALRGPIVLVTHDLDEAASWADRLCVIEGGETLQAGSPAEVLAAPANDRVRRALDLVEL